MYKKLNQLSFVIGLFFTIVSLVLFINTLFTQTGRLVTVYTAVAFLIFGLFMIYVSSKERN